MKKVIRMVVTALILLSLPGCSKQEPSVVKIYEATDSELVEEYLEKDELVTLVRYYEMSDGTWKTENHTYLYRLEITGKIRSRDSTFVILSNTKDITFDEAWRASGISSNSNAYFREEDAIFVAWKSI